MSIITAALPAHSIDIATGNAPPYQVSSNGDVVGKSVDVIKCIMAKTNSPFDITLYPWRRALRLLEVDDIDMLFSLSKQLSNFPASQSSSPIVLEKWYWFSREQKPTGLDSKIAVVAGSSEEHWLRDQQYKQVDAVDSLASAIKMLNSQRVELVLSDAKKAESILMLSPLITSGWHKKFVKFDTQAVYFSQKFTEQNPAYLKKFNSALIDCNPVGVGLEPRERSILNQLAQKLSNSISDTLLLQTLKSSQLSKTEFAAVNIEALDEQWRAHTESAPFALVRSIMTSELSEHLKKQSPSWSNTITEIIVTDNVGQTIAASKMPSDYWQGDEDSYLAVRQEPHGSYHISEVYFDESTGQFQTQLSLKIDDTHEGFIGVIIFGIDLEKAYLSFN